MVTGADDIFAFGSAADLARTTGKSGRVFLTGEDIRDYCIAPNLASVWLYNSAFQPVALVEKTPIQKHLWQYRPTLSNRKLYGQPILEAGLHWFRITVR